MKQNKWSLISLVGLLALNVAACHKPAPPDDDDGAPITLEAVGDEVIMLGYGESANLGVRARYQDDGSPAADRKVSFMTAGTLNGAALEGNEFYTDDAGLATAKVTASDTKANFNVIASSGSANQVQFTIDINGQDIGSLRVFYNQPAGNTYKFTRLVTKIHTQDFNCKDFDDWDTLPEAQAEKESLSANLPVLFEDLMQGDKFTVSVRAYGPEGNEIARGCEKSGAIVGRKVTDVYVPLEMLPTSFTGTYQMATALNLTEMIPTGTPDPKNPFVNSEGKADAGLIVKAIINILSDPADFLVSLIESNPVWTLPTWASSLLKGALSAGASAFCPSHDGLDDETGEASADEELFAWSHKEGNKVVMYSCECVSNSSCGSNAKLCGVNKNEDCSNRKSPEGSAFLDVLLFGYTPDTVASVFQAANDITEMIQHLVVGGEYEITKAVKNGNVYNLEGTEKWNKYMFTWSLGQECNDVCCGRHVFGAGQSSNNTLDAVSARFTGTATPTNVSGLPAYYLAIDEHALQIDYGKIIKFILENIAFPAITKLEAPVTTSAVLATVIPLSTVACWADNNFSTDGAKYENCKDTCKIEYKSNDKTITNSGCGNGTLMELMLKLISWAGDQADSSLASLSTPNSGTEKYKFTLRTDDNWSVENLITDTNNDLQTDNLKLHLSGNLYLGDDTNNATSLTGEMKAEFARTIVEDLNAIDRTSCHSDQQCVDAIGAGHTCQIRMGLVSECDERMVCALNVGNYAGGASCSNHNDCASGVCLTDTNTCFSACGNSGDCTSSSASVCNESITYTFPDTSLHATVSSCTAN